MIILAFYIGVFMKISFYGGAKEVGRSCFILEKKGKEIFLDCGIKLGKRIDFPIVEDIPSYGIISHAHLDHVGYLPHIIRDDMSILSTKPTMELSNVLLSDYRRISQSFKPEDVSKTMKRFKWTDYEKQISLNGFNAMLFDAGHIMGSAMTLIDNRVLYTGDLNTRGSKILNPAKPVKAETLIIESTYGKKDDHIPSMKESLSKLSKIINETIENNGIVIIPSFAVGRGQEILIALDAYMRSGVIKRVPIYVDGMVKKAMRIYRQNVIYARKEIQMQILMSLHDPFRSELFKVPKTIDRSDVKRPSIIVTTSGMLTGGPIIHYLNNFGNDERNTLIFTGYQAEGTPGREVLEGKRRITYSIDDEVIEIDIGLRIEHVKFSGHSDHNDLIKFAKETRAKNIIIVHGEEKAVEELGDDLGKKANVFKPSLGETLII